MDLLRYLWPFNTQPDPGLLKALPSPFVSMFNDILEKAYWRGALDGLVVMAVIVLLAWAFLTALRNPPEKKIYQNNQLLVLAGILLAVILGYASLRNEHAKNTPTPPIPAPPIPTPPKPKRDLGSAAVEEIYRPTAGAPTREGGPVSPDGKTEVQVDLPQALRKKNISSPPPNGPGCCVFRSIDFASKWQHEAALYDFPEWMVDHNVAGGGWPDKVTELVKKISADRGLPEPEILQYSGDDPSLIAAALKSGRLPCITYCGRDCHYGPSKSVAHMTNCVCYDANTDQVAILDNNFIGGEELVWMSVRDFLERYKGNGTGWTIVLLAPPPVPVPHN